MIPVAEKLKLFECKWSERLIGAKNIISKTLITPVRQQRVIKSKDLIIENSIELQSLAI